MSKKIIKLDPYSKEYIERFGNIHLFQNAPGYESKSKQAEELATKGIEVTITKPTAEKINEEILVPISCQEFEAALHWLKSFLAKEISNRHQSLGTIQISDDNEEFKNALEKQQFQKFLEYLEFRPPTKLSNHWFIPYGISKEELKADTELIQSVLISNEMLTSKGFDASKCKICGRIFPYLLQHLAKSINCKQKYSDSELDVLKETSKMSVRYMNHERYQRNKLKRKKQMAEYYQANKQKWKKK